MRYKEELLPILWKHDQRTDKNFRQIMVRGSADERCKMPAVRESIRFTRGTYILKDKQGNKVGFREWGFPRLCVSSALGAQESSSLYTVVGEFDGEGLVK